MSNFIRILSILTIYIIVNIESHAYFSSIAVDGTQYAEGTCIRPHPSSKYDYPISSIDKPQGINSGDMTCGFLPAASKPANKKCPVNPGSTITIQWHYEMGLGNADTFIIDPSHKGPCIVYMAKSETGAGNVWFKIFEDGYNANTKQWCVDKLRANKGKFSVTIPTDITPGNYLLRAELIALHEGFELGGAQPYVHCAEITVSGSGNVNPNNLVSFPGAYKATDKGLYFDIYPVKGAYPIPGPSLYISGSVISPSVTTSINQMTSNKLTTSPLTTSKKPVTSSKLTTVDKSLTTSKKSSTTTSSVLDAVTTKSKKSYLTTEQVISSVTTSENLQLTTDFFDLNETINNQIGIINGVSSLNWPSVYVYSLLLILLYLIM